MNNLESFSSAFCILFWTWTMSNEIRSFFTLSNNVHAYHMMTMSWLAEKLVVIYIIESNPTSTTLRSDDIFISFVSHLFIQSLDLNAHTQNNIHLKRLS